MKTSLNIFNEIIRRREAHGNISDDNPLKYEDVVPYIDMAIADALTAYKRQEKQNGDIYEGFINAFLKEYKCQKVLKDESCCNNEWYFVLPVDVIPISNDDGVYLVTWNERPVDKISRREFAQNNLLPTNLSNTPSCCITGDRIYFSNEINNVFLYLLPKPSEMDANENLPIPPTFNQFVDDYVWDKVLKFSNGEKDIVNDSQSIK